MPELPPVPAEATPEALVDRFLARFGASSDLAVLHRDKAGQTVTISRALFEDSEGRLKVTKRGRADAIDRLAETLLDPDEIWVDWDVPRAGGALEAPRLVRTYLRYDPQSALVTGFTWAVDAWQGLTAHVRTAKGKADPDHRALERRRHGALLYRRSSE